MGTIFVFGILSVDWPPILFAAAVGYFAATEKRAALYGLAIGLIAAVVAAFLYDNAFSYAPSADDLRKMSRLIPSDRWALWAVRYAITVPACVGAAWCVRGLKYGDGAD